MNIKNLNKLNTNKYFIIFIFVVSFVLSFGSFLTTDFFAQAKGLGYLGLFIINFFASATFFVSGPAFLTVIAGGEIYNPLLVALVASFGAALGDLISFLLGFSARSLALKKIEKKFWFSTFEMLIKKYSTVVILIFAFIPNPFFDAVGLIAGIFKIEIKRFFALVLIGRFLRFLVLALIGAKIG